MPTDIVEEARKDMTTVLSMRQFMTAVCQVECSQCGVTDERGGSEAAAALGFCSTGWTVLDDDGTEELWCPECVKGITIHD